MGHFDMWGRALLPCGRSGKRMMKDLLPVWQKLIRVFLTDLRLTVRKNFLQDL